MGVQQQEMNMSLMPISPHSNCGGPVLLTDKNKDTVGKVESGKGLEWKVMWYHVLRRHSLCSRQQEKSGFF